jgi:hypothetical protein
MAVFMHVYYWTYISKPELSVGDVLSHAMKLGDLQQVCPCVEAVCLDSAMKHDS